MEQKIQISFPLGVVKTALTDAIDMRLDELIGQCGSMDVDAIAKECININAQTVVEQYDFAAMVSSKISREIAAIDFDNLLAVKEAVKENVAAIDFDNLLIVATDGYMESIEDHIKKTVTQAVDEALKENLEHWTSRTLWDVIDGHVVNQDIPALIRAEAAKHISRATDQDVLTKDQLLAIMGLLEEAADYYFDTHDHQAFEDHFPPIPVMKKTYGLAMSWLTNLQKTAKGPGIVKAPQANPDMVGFVIELSNLLADRDDYDAVLKPQLVKLLEVVCAR